jgi:uncharacterized protein
MLDTAPPEFWQGIQQFNQQEFYACHDTLEALWMVAEEPEKTFYQGVLQVAVGLYHLSNENWRGAAILLGEGSNRIGRSPPDFFAVDVDDLLMHSTALLTALQQAGPERVAEFSQWLANGQRPDTCVDELTLPFQINTFSEN